MSLPENVLKNIAAGAGQRKIDFLVIHTAGAPGGVDQSAANIRAYHTSPTHPGGPWLDIGYNFVARKSGLVELGRPLAQVPAQAKGFNQHALGICFTGNGDLSNFTLAQYDAARLLVPALMARFGVPVAHVIGHREVSRFGGPPPGKTCPGKLIDMAAFRDMMAVAK